MFIENVSRPLQSRMKIKKYIRQFHNHILQNTHNVVSYNQTINNKNDVNEMYKSTLEGYMDSEKQRKKYAKMNCP